MPCHYKGFLEGFGHSGSSDDVKKMHWLVAVAQAACQISNLRNLADGRGPTLLSERLLVCLGDLARNAPRGILLSFFLSSFFLPSADRRGGRSRVGARSLRRFALGGPKRRQVALPSFDSPFDWSSVLFHLSSVHPSLTRSLSHSGGTRAGCRTRTVAAARMHASLLSLPPSVSPGPHVQICRKRAVAAVGQANF